MKPDLRKLALRAYRLRLKKITGDELAARLKVSTERARDLADIGANIVTAERCDLTRLEWEAMKALARVLARKVHLGEQLRCNARDVDFAAHKRTGWCWRIVTKRMSVESLDGTVPIDRLGFVHIMVDRRRLWLTAAGWAFVWGTGLVKPNWRVPA